MIVSLLLLTLAAVVNGARSPVVIMPGDGGSRLQGRTNETSTVHYLCRTHENWFTFWISEFELTPYVIDCFTHRMSLVYNLTTRSSHTPKGVEITTTEFGSTDTMEWLDDYHLVSAANYFSDVVAHLTKNLGYVKGKSLFGAPYDFRYAPNSMEVFFKNLTALIEHAYEVGGSTPVTILGHSMGNVNTLYFLQHKPDAWKEKYIARFVSLSGPYAGSVKIMRLLTSGDNLNVYTVSPLEIRGCQRTFPSSHYLAPSLHFWKTDEVVVTVGTRSWTMHQLEDYYSVLNISHLWPLREDTAPLLNPLTPPNVEVHVLHGINTTTTGGLIYDPAKFPDVEPTIIPTDGDGTVPKRSLLAPLLWRKQQKQQVYHFEIENTDHNGILHHPKLMAYLDKLLGVPSNVDEAVYSADTAA